MGLIDDLKERFATAKQRQTRLAESLSESREHASRRQQMELQLEAEEAALKVEEKQQRFREIVRELPVLALDFDRAAVGLIDAWNAIETANQARQNRLRQLMRDHGLDTDFDLEGGRRTQPGAGWNLSNKTIPDWVPVKSRKIYRNNEAVGYETLTTDYYGMTMARALSSSWKKAQESEAHDGKA